MLAAYEERILSNHQIPADGRVTRDVRAAVPEAQAIGRSPPAFREIAESSNRCAVGTKEQVVVGDRSARLEVSIKIELTFESSQGPRTQANDPILTRFGHVSIYPVDARLGDGERPREFIEVSHA
jgi:hypothetical protein